MQRHGEDHGAIHGSPRSLFLRHLDCGSCNACELELNALTNPLYDLGRWGIRFEASPRHADVLVLTGPYVRGLDRAARATVEAMPVPRIVTVGDCAAQETILKDAYGIVAMPDEIKNAVRAHVSGCPPSPRELLEALLRLDVSK